jgi:hypothetical protein
MRLIAPPVRSPTPPASRAISDFHDEDHQRTCPHSSLNRPKGGGLDEVCTYDMCRMNVRDGSVAGILAGRDERREPDQQRYSRSGAKRRDFTIRNSLRRPHRGAPGTKFHTKSRPRCNFHRLRRTPGKALNDVGSQRTYSTAAAISGPLVPPRRRGRKRRRDGLH